MHLHVDMQTQQKAVKVTVELGMDSTANLTMNKLHIALNLVTNKTYTLTNLITLKPHTNVIPLTNKNMLFCCDNACVCVYTFFHHTAQYVPEPGDKAVSNFTVEVRWECTCACQSLNKELLPVFVFISNCYNQHVTQFVNLRLT
jgi:hypothetical protein